MLMELRNAVVDSAERFFHTRSPLIPTTNSRSVYVSTWPQQGAVPPCTSARAKIYQLLNGSRAPIRMMRNLFALSNAPWHDSVRRKGNQLPKAMIGISRNIIPSGSQTG